MTSIFSTMPDKDYLGFGSGASMDFRKIVKFVDFKKADVSRATGVPVGSVRYKKEKMPKELKDRLMDLGYLFNFVASYFRGDMNKTKLWFQLSNPLLAELSPRDMIRIGRYKKLCSFVMNSIEENRRAG
jgi:hypothetical protein